MLLGLLAGSDLLIVLGIVVVLFGGSQIPKLARSLGSASHEFKKGAATGDAAATAPPKGTEDGSTGAAEG